MRMYAKCMMMASIAAVVVSAQELKWNGSVQYRLRANIQTENDAKGEEAKGKGAVDVHHQYGWALGVMAKANDEVSLTFQLDNPGTYDGTSRVGNNSGVFFNNEMKHSVQVSKAFFTYKRGFFTFDAGVVPVAPNSALDIGVNLIDHKGLPTLSNYFDMGMGWSDVIASQIGTNFVFAAGEKVKFNVNVAVADDNNKMVTNPLNESTHKDRLDGYRLALSAPVTLGKIVLTPATSIQTGLYDAKTDANIMFAGGLDITAKPTDKIDLRGGGGYGMVEIAGDTLVAKNKIEAEGRSALYVKLDPRFTIGKGKLGVAYSLAMVTDDAPYTLNATKDTVKVTKDKDGKTVSSAKFTKHYFDVSYTFNPNKNFSIRPRFRTYLQSRDYDDYSWTRIRPELIFAAKF